MLPYTDPRGYVFTVFYGICIAVTTLPKDIQYQSRGNGDLLLIGPRIDVQVIEYSTWYVMVIMHAIVTEYKISV